MNGVTITPKQLSAQQRFCNEVRLIRGVGDKGWFVDVWLEHADGEIPGQSGFFLSSDRQPEHARLFRTADAALRVLAGLGFERVVIQRR